MRERATSAGRRVSRVAARAAALLALLAAAPAAGQVSPGPLASAHASLDAAARCFSCHVRGSEVTDRCLACHREIAALRDAGRGIHGREAAREPCATCHPDHAGRDFDLVHWEEGSAERFDHARAGWALEGRHAATACAACHKPAYQRSPVARLMDRERPGESWLGLEPDCASCHDDPHEARLGADCGGCHAAVGWREVDRRAFDHGRTLYPLRGRHAAVACERCHDAPGLAHVPRPAHDACAACHEDAHAGQAALAGTAADCAACHTVEGFRPSTFAAADHAAAGYPLEGRHRVVACAACHPKEGARAALLGAAAVQLRRPHGRCGDCHADAHAGQLAARPGAGACEECHTVDGFRPSTYGVDEHAATDFPIDGRHAAAACAACHGPERPGLAPLPDSGELGAARVALRLEERTCEACHADPHGGRFSPGGARPARDGCATCHASSGFHPSLVDVGAHARFPFPLEGAHRAVPCAACHAEVASATTDVASGARNVASVTRDVVSASPDAGRRSLIGSGGLGRSLPFTVARQECAACHEDAHGGQFAERPGGGGCEVCHGTDAFRPAPRFDHGRDAAFRLDGAHARVACAECHPRRDAAGGAQVVAYRGVSARCEACHDGPAGRAPREPGGTGVRAAADGSDRG